MKLLERDAELHALDRLRRSIDTGKGCTVLVTGEAGIGKSALLEEFLERHGEGCRVAWGTCDALPTPRALGPVYEIASALAVANAPADGPREALFGALLSDLSRAPHPTVLIIEDLHWADEATLDFVRFLGRRIQRTRCLVVVTYRDDEVPALHPLRRVIGELPTNHTHRIRLAPLSLAAVQQLSSGHGDHAARIFEITRGNPFFVGELLAAPCDKVPQTVRDAIVARLLRCSPAARRVAELVSVVPGRAETWLVDSVLGEARRAVDEAVERGLVITQEAAVTFRHELARLAVESTLTERQARDLHAQVLRALQAHGADLARVVHHAELADVPGAVLEIAPRAGREAARVGAHREAASHFAAALRHARSLPESELADLLEAHAIECVFDNQVAAAIASAVRAVALRKETCDVAGQARMLRSLARYYWAAGRRADADEAAADAVTLLEGLDGGPELAMAYSARSQLAMLSGNIDEAIELGQRALGLAEQFADRATESHALNNIGSTLLGSGDENGYELLERSLKIALEHDLVDHAARAYTNLSTCSILRHDLARAERFLNAGQSYCEEHENHMHLAYMRAYATRLALEKGQWDEAESRARELLEVPNLAAVQRIPTLLTLALVRARRGSPGVEELLDEAWAVALPTGELQRIGRVAAARAEHAWYAGDLQRVADETERGLAHAVGHRDPWIKGELAWWRSRAGIGEPVDGIAEPYRLMIAGDWQRAAETWQRLGLPYERLLALSLGSIEAQRECLAALDGMGATALAAIVRRRLREQGELRLPRGPRPTTLANPANLTNRELQVLQLLVRGYTNVELGARLHLSPRTIDRHVSAILDKLDVRSRAEATAAAFRLGVAERHESDG